MWGGGEISLPLHEFVQNSTNKQEYDKAKRQNLRRYASKFMLRELFFGTRRAVKTKEETRRLFDELHSSPMGGHTGIHKTRSALCSRFYWYRMSVDIDRWVCIPFFYCKHAKHHKEVILLPYQVSAVWELVGTDLTGPLPKTTSGCQYILTATDYFSKWVEAYPLKTKAAAEVAEQLYKIVYRHGCPARILSDQGREFVNELNTRLCEMLKIDRTVTAAYHPQTNGLDEKTNDNIKSLNAALVNDQQNNWGIFLDATLFSLRSKVHTTTKHTPFQFMYGREACFPSEVPAELPVSVWSFLYTITEIVQLLASENNNLCQCTAVAGKFLCFLASAVPVQLLLCQIPRKN
uniref:Gypsy retrotransposon integrase-like protein 1 n=1 Tax=Myripristis murdjan TaxID=586833 RepID=A0A667XSF1_9TELE